MQLSDQSIDNIIKNILEEMDKSTLMGAALDCMDEIEKLKFRSGLRKILRNEQLEYFNMTKRTEI